MTTRWLALVALCAAAGCVGNETAEPESTAAVGQAFAPPADAPETLQLLRVRDSKYTVRGDFNGDGLRDYAYGDPNYNDAGLKVAGRVLVYHATSCGEVPDIVPDHELRPGLAGLPGAPAERAWFGRSQAVTDINGDGFDDLIMGAPAHGHGTISSGAVYIAYGSATGLQGASSQRIDLDSPGMIGTGQPDDGFGYTVAAADFNCDGFGDVAVSAPRKSVAGQSFAGTVSILYGTAAGLTTIGNQLISRNSGDLAMAAAPYDRFGSALAAAEFTSAKGNSCADLAIGVPYADEAGPNAGAVHLLYGAPAGLSVTGTDHFHEGMAGVLSFPNNNEGFGTRLGHWDDNHDGLQDLLVYNALGEKCPGRGATHLLLGGSGGVTDLDDKYACGYREGPRFDITVEPPKKPRRYSAPQGTPANNSAELIALLTNGVPDVIILEDDVIYDHTTYIVPDAADQIWARHLGRATLRFGLYYQFQPTPVKVRSELHGVTFDIDDTNNVISDVNGNNSAIVLAAPAGASMSLLVEDCFFYGNNLVDAGLVVRRPDDLEIRRVVVRNVHDAGIRVDNAGGASNGAPTVTIEDVDVAGVFKTDADAVAQSNMSPLTSYFCQEEVGLFVGLNLDHANVNRVRVRDTRCAGILTAVNVNETVNNAGSYQNLDVDCAGHWPATTTAAGNISAVTNAGLYLQESSLALYQQIHIGAHTFDGVRSEHTGDNNGNAISGAVIESHRVGIALDVGTDDTKVDNVEIDNAYCAGVLDNYCGAPWGGTCDPAQTTNGIGEVDYHLAPGALEVAFFNANQCPAPPP